MNDLNAHQDRDLAEAITWHDKPTTGCQERPGAPWPAPLGRRDPNSAQPSSVQRPTTEPTSCHECGLPFTDIAEIDPDAQAVRLGSKSLHRDCLRRSSRWSREEYAAVLGGARKLTPTDRGIQPEEVLADAWIAATSRGPQPSPALVSNGLQWAADRQLQKALKRDSRETRYRAVGDDDPEAPGLTIDDLTSAEADLHGTGPQDPADVVIAVQESERIARAVNALPDSLRDVFVAVVLDGRSGGDVATDLGVSRQAVNQRVKRARQILALALSDLAPIGTTDDVIEESA